MFLLGNKGLFMFGPSLQKYINSSGEAQALTRARQLDNYINSVYTSKTSGRLSCIGSLSDVSSAIAVSSATGAITSCGATASTSNDVSFLPNFNL